MTYATLSNDVKSDLHRFISELEIMTPADVDGEPCADCANDNPCEFDCNAMSLTVSTNDTGNEWAYQTGCNSYSGACYFHPHWAVVSITQECDRASIVAEIIDQLEELLPANR